MKIKFSALILLLLVSFAVNSSYAQYKPVEKKKTSYLDRSTDNLILGIFNPKNFSMHHSFGLSMMNSSSGNVSLATYTNSMNYKISDKLNISADVSMQYSPYASSSLGKAYSTDLQNSLSGIYLSRASLDYKISDNSSVRVEFRNLNGYSQDYFNNGSFNPFLYR
ncbi:hypothetical protein BH10BAC5_BH10BAC5_23030 [soil metagenome]